MHVILKLWKYVHSHLLLAKCQLKLDADTISYHIIENLKKEQHIILVKL